MANRTRTHFPRYGGETCATSWVGNYTVPAFVGERSCTDETHPGPPYRTGGPLVVRKKYFDIQRFTPFRSDISFIWYHGYLSAAVYVPSPEPTPLNLSGWGAKGWNRTVPTHPIYNLGVSLIELKDVQRMLTQTKHFFTSIRGFSFSRSLTSVRRFLSDLSKGPKYVADHYLNVSFGWVPFLQDLHFVTQMYEKLSRKLRWLRRHNGKPVYRRVTLDDQAFSEDVARFTTGPGTMSQPLASQLYKSSTSPGNYPCRKDYKHRIWYVAKYRYWIPELAKINSLLSFPRKLSLQLLGLDLDPTTLYKAYPWTWLLDWFSSAGSVVQNVFAQAKYSVLAEYAYVMCSEKFTYTAPAQVTVNTGEAVYPLYEFPSSMSFSGASRTYYEFKQRQAANPFGFGITFASLSAFQWSILVALGLSRGGKGFSPRT